jgi:hypothetical protein
MDHILPHAENVNADMFRELSDLVKNREQMLRPMNPGRRAPSFSRYLRKGSDFIFYSSIDLDLPGK